MWESQVLVRGENSTCEQVGLTHVVQEPADVAIETGIDAVLVLWLGVRTYLCQNKALKEKKYNSLNKYTKTKISILYLRNSNVVRTIASQLKKS